MSPAARPLALLLSLVLAGCLVGCAAQKDGAGSDEVAPSEGATIDASAYEPLPECTTDADCRLSVYREGVASPEDCYCPGCPTPQPAGEAAAREHGWRVQCASWAETRECAVPMCAPPPGEVACVEGRCGWRVDEGGREP